MNKVKLNISELKEIQFLRYLMVGSIVTTITILLTYTFYNIVNLGYWLSSAVAYAIATFISYYLNRRFTFQFQENNLLYLIKFASVIAICYCISYFIAKPMTKFALNIFSDNFSMREIEQVAMLVGLGISIVFNYMGQKLFVFVKNTAQGD